MASTGASGLGTAPHQGLIEPRIDFGNRRLRNAVVAAVLNGLLVPVFIAVVGFSLVSAYASYRLGYNPDDTTVPIVTNVADVTGVLVLFGVVSVVL